MNSCHVLLCETSQAVNRKSIGATLSFYTTSRIESDIDERSHQQGTRRATTHKEEMPGRIESVAKNRENIQYKLDMCIEALNNDNYPEVHCQIVTGRIAPDAVNIADSGATGTEPMKQYETGWPESFYEPLSNKVVTMSVSKSVPS